jgi:predicted DNA-binding antitoxin AbrB/MazE fold protein
MTSLHLIYENGVFRSVNPLDLAEGTQLEVEVVHITGAAPLQAQNGTDKGDPLVGEELAALLDQVADMPYTPHPDGRTDISEHHDDILYPKQGKQP